MHPLGITIAPNIIRKDGPVTFIDLVAHRLPNQMGRDGIQLQVILLQQILDALVISGIGFSNIHMVGKPQFHTVITKSFRLAAYLL